MAMYAISNDVGDKKSYCNRRAKEITTDVADSLQCDISNEIKSLNDKLIKRKKSLDQQINEANIDGLNTKISLNPDFDGALDNLDINFGDIGNFIMAAGGAILGYFALVGIWSPLGWFAAVASIVSWLFGGRDKEAEAKKKMRMSIYKAKRENRSAFDAQISKILNAIDQNCNNIIISVDKDRVNLEKLRNYVQSLIESVKIEYSQLKISNYGKLS